MTWARGPITADEALGVARRLGRLELERGRAGQRAGIPEELPPPGALRSSTFRLDARVLAHVRARAEAEGLGVTDVVRAALQAYATGRPGTPTTYEPTYPGSAGLATPT